MSLIIKQTESMGCQNNIIVHSLLFVYAMHNLSSLEVSFKNVVLVPSHNTMEYSLGSLI